MKTSIVTLLLCGSIMVGCTEEKGELDTQVDSTVQQEQEVSVEEEKSSLEELEQKIEELDKQSQELEQRIDTLLNEL